MNRVKQLDWNDIAVRALRTFVQAAIPIFLASLSGVDWAAEGDALRAAVISVCISGGAAGVSAVWNMVTGVLSANGIVFEDIPETDECFDGELLEESDTDTETETETEDEIGD